MKNVVALVLAGGSAAEFGVLTQNRVKGALSFAANFRIIDFALSNLRNSGIDKVGMIIQYLPASLIEHVGEGRAWDFHGYGRALKLMPPFVGNKSTSWYRGTAEAIDRNMNFVQDQNADTVLVLSGEHVYYEDFRSVLDFHFSNNADITMVVKNLPKEEKQRRFGYAIIDENNRVQKFIEKPQTVPSDGLVSTGTYIFKRRVLEALLSKLYDNNENKNLTRDLLQEYAHTLNSYAYITTNYWHYLGTPSQYLASQMELTRGEGLAMLKSWNIMTNPEDRNSGFRPPAFFTQSAQIEDTIVSSGCRIEGTVSHSILSPGVQVKFGATVSNCILMHDCIVEPGARVEGVIADKDVVFGTNSRVGFEMPPEGIPQDYYTRCADLILLPKGCKIMPRSNVPKGVQLDVFSQ